jgi:hypothetical protein
MHSLKEINYIYIQLNALLVHLVGYKCNWTKMHGIHGIKIIWRKCLFSIQWKFYNLFDE